MEMADKGLIGRQDTTYSIRDTNFDSTRNTTTHDYFYAIRYTDVHPILV